MERGTSCADFFFNVSHVLHSIGYVLRKYKRPSILSSKSNHQRYMFQCNCIFGGITTYFLLKIQYIKRAHLDTRIADGTATQVVKRRNLLQNVLGDDEALSLEKALVSIGVHADGEAGDFSGLEGGDPVLRQSSDGRGQARGQTAGGHHGDVDVSVGVGHGWFR